ncbi:hypothetical protein SAMN06266956_10289 [Paraburkholderia hospita]|nr:hypothetical protein SAMN06266956_10289 [Paraburkholderia hospita]
MHDCLILLETLKRRSAAFLWMTWQLAQAI